MGTLHRGAMFHNVILEGKNQVKAQYSGSSDEHPGPRVLRCAGVFSIQTVGFGNGCNFPSSTTHASTSTFHHDSADAGGSTKALLPVHCDFGDAAAFVVVFEQSVFDGVLVDALGDLHVEGAVLGDFAEWGEIARFFVFLPPAEGIEPVCRFSGAKSCRGHGVEFEAETDDFFQLEHHVEIERLLAERVENVRL